MDTISAHGSVTSMLLLENYDRPTNQPNHPTDEPTDGQGGSLGSSEDCHLLEVREGKRLNRS